MSRTNPNWPYAYPATRPSGLTRLLHLMMGYPVSSVSQRNVDNEDMENAAIARWRKLTSEDAVLLCEEEGERIALERWPSYARYVLREKQLDDELEVWIRNAKKNGQLSPVSTSAEELLPEFSQDPVSYPTLSSPPSLITLPRLQPGVRVRPSARLLGYLAMYHPIDQIAILAKVSPPCQMPLYIHELGRHQFAGHEPGPAVERYAVFDPANIDSIPKYDPDDPVARRSVPYVPYVPYDEASPDTVISRRFVKNVKRQSEAFVWTIMKRNDETKEYRTEKMVLKRFRHMASTCEDTMTLADKKRLTPTSYSRYLLGGVVTRFKEESEGFPENESDGASASTSRNNSHFLRL